MRPARSLLLALVALLGAGLLGAQSFAPPPVHPPDEALLKKIKEKTEELDRAVKECGRSGVEDDYLVDVEVFHKAAVWIVKHNEWYHKDYAQWTLDALEMGLDRASHLRQRQAPWLTQTGRVVRGYRSMLDGSVQPYAVVLPRAMSQDLRKKWRTDVILHGRDASLTEVKFIHQHSAPAAAADPQEYIQLHVYGRGNNAYRWAGEMDVLESMGAFHSTSERFLGREIVDAQRIVLRGFSMGGAGAWHLGLHFCGHWCSVSPGAGFSTTRGYVKNLPERLPPYQEACLRIYDAVEYAENAFNVPIVAYGGEKDPQLQAARNIEERLKPLNIPFTLIVGPNTEHRYHPDSLKKILELQAEHAAAGKDQNPKEIRFVTYTPIYTRCLWLSVYRQERPYERSRIHAERTEHGYRIATENVQLLFLTPEPGAMKREALRIEIDGTTLDAPVLRDTGGRDLIALEKSEKGWRLTLADKVEVDEGRQSRKSVGKCGPIDHAFRAPFLCVRGTGKAWHESTQRYAQASLERFQKEWDKYFRGELRVCDDKEVLAGDLRNLHLIVFGDPASNSILGHALDRLPLQWSREAIVFGGQRYEADGHVPVLIYPSPFSSSHYLVVNTGHTFHAADFEGTNALLYPRLGDYAILKLTGDVNDPLAMEVATAGLFDTHWRVGK